MNRVPCTCAWSLCRARGEPQTSLDAATEVTPASERSPKDRNSIATREFWSRMGRDEGAEVKSKRNVKESEQHSWVERYKNQSEKRTRLESLYHDADADDEYHGSKESQADRGPWLTKRSSGNFTHAPEYCIELLKMRIVIRHFACGSNRGRLVRSDSESPLQARTLGNWRELIPPSSSVQSRGTAPLPVPLRMMQNNFQNGNLRGSKTLSPYSS